MVHSLTKYIGGHGDALGGAIAGSSEAIGAIRHKSRIRVGGILSPFNAWLILRGAATLPLRMKQHEANAFAVAQWLEANPRVKRVIYPGLPSHPQHELARRQMKNFSGMVTFQVENGEKVAPRFAEKLKIIHYAVSLGHHRSLLFYLPTEALRRTTFHLTPDQSASWREFAGDGIFRFSVGLEDADDIIADLEQALA
ncbi:Cystathionine gamma-synthase [bioreactor metagenome]|uniref:Cystathionine gamma-synthase n=1 Tax=bioreactor metagenome TaxID=1076179 RepID=A0A645HZT9_9ZZZZ